MDKCCICGKALPNAWAVGKTETVGGEVRRYCHLHAGGATAAGRRRGEAAPESEFKPEAKPERRAEMSETKERAFHGDGGPAEREERERAIAQRATGERAKKAWNECAALAAKLGGGIKAMWGKLRPDRSPEATLAALGEDLKANRARLDALKPELDGVYRQIVAKNKEYQAAAPARQRLCKTELQTLLARYKGLEREFGILSENERSIETVKARFLEVLAYGKRGRVDEDLVDRLTDDVDGAAEDAESVQDALGDLDRSGRRKERGDGDFDAALAEFDGELGMAEEAGPGEGTDVEATKENGESEDETDHVEPRVGDGDWN